MADSQIKIYELRHPGSCTGMFWRANPFKPESQEGNEDWPRNGSILKGYPRGATEGAPASPPAWLEVVEWQQAGSKSSIRPCRGLWMPFHQGGLLLHERESDHL